MSKSTDKLRLGPLPRTEMIKLTISMPTDLKASLDRYASLHSQAHGEGVDAAALIPHMLAAFIARDRDSRRYVATLSRKPFIRRVNRSQLLPPIRWKQEEAGDRAGSATHVVRN